MSLTGSATGTTATDGSGNYTFSGLTPGGSYTVTPMKPNAAPGSAGINTFDVIAAQQHYLAFSTLTGCPLVAADVSNDGRVDTTDVVVIQRFFLGHTTGTANAGKYKFTPANRTYSNLVANQSGQDYDALLYGDVVASFSHRPDHSLMTETSVYQMSANVAAVSLPNVIVDTSVSDFVGRVTTTTINAADKLIGFQGDFTFDERAIRFDEYEPVQKAGLTKGNWIVSGHVLPGTGPIRTLRVSAYSTDLTPLSGLGILFELKVIETDHSEAVSLIWAESPDDFTFIDTDLSRRKPAATAHGSVQPNGEPPDQATE